MIARRRRNRRSQPVWRRTGGCHASAGRAEHRLHPPPWRPRCRRRAATRGRARAFPGIGPCRGCRCRSGSPGGRGRCGDRHPLQLSPQGADVAPCRRSESRPVLNVSPLKRDVIAGPARNERRPDYRDAAGNPVGFDIDLLAGQRSIVDPCATQLTQQAPRTHKSCR